MRFLLCVLLIAVACSGGGCATPEAKIVIYPEDVHMFIGQSVVIPCVVAMISNNGSTPSIDIAWSYNTMELSSTPNRRVHSPVIFTKSGVTFIKSVLELCVTDGNTGGQYSCVATQHEKIVDEEKFHINIHVHTVVNTSSVTNVSINSNHHLFCDFLGYPLPTNLTWTFNGRPTNPEIFSKHQELITGSSGEIIIRSHLSFYAHSTLFSGNYTCTAQRDLIRAQFSFQVYVQVPAEIIVGPASSNHGVASSIILSCAAYGLPVPTVTWTYNKHTVSNGFTWTHQEMVHGVYVVRSFLQLCPEDEETRNGQYSCEVDNAITDSSGTAMKTLDFNLCFLRNFGIIATPSDQDIVEGGVYYLPCMAYSKNGRAVSITWTDASATPLNTNTSKMTLLEESVTKDNISIVHSILEISCASFEIAAEYACMATDGIESGQTSFTLRFTFGPIFHEQPNVSRELTADKNGNISFSCIVSGQPPPIVTWIKDGEHLMMKDVNFSIYESQVPGFTGLEETALESTLYLSWLSGKDSGSYWCRAENRLGKIDMTMGYTLTVQGQGLPEIELDTSGLLQSEVIGYVSYTGSVFCILPLLAVALAHLFVKSFSHKKETLAILNFCAATSLLYILYMPVSSVQGTSSGPVCALLSALFHLFFLAAAFSISNLVFVSLFRNHSRAKLLSAIAIILNWAVLLLVLVVSISPNISYYMNDNRCIPVQWPLWFGLILPAAATHVLSWVTLLFSPLLMRLPQLQACDDPATHPASPPSSPCKLREPLTNGCILILFELAWGVQIVALSTDLSTDVTAVLQTVFIVSSTCLGVLAFLSFFCDKRVPPTVTGLVEGISLEAPTSNGYAPTSNDNPPISNGYQPLDTPVQVVTMTEKSSGELEDSEVEVKHADL